MNKAEVIKAIRTNISHETPTTIMAEVMSLLTGKYYTPTADGVERQEACTRATLYEVTPYHSNERGGYQYYRNEVEVFGNLADAQALAAKWVRRDGDYQPYDKVTITATRELEVWK